MQERQAFRILLVEDNAADADLVREALDEADVLYELKTLTDGAEALRYLRGAGVHAGAAVPELVLLDLNLPGMNGMDVLRSIKGDPDLKRIPTVILTSSRHRSDILGSYDLHANSYIAKPTDVEEFFQAVHELRRFWLGTALLPGRA